MNILKKYSVFMLIIVLILTTFKVPVSAEIRPKKTKVETSEKTNVILFVNTKTRLKLKNAPKGQKIKWSSNNKKIATVTQNGKVTAKKAGKAKITAKTGGEKIYLSDYRKKES